MPSWHVSATTFCRMLSLSWQTWILPNQVCNYITPFRMYNVHVWWHVSKVEVKWEKITSARPPPLYTIIKTAMDPYSLHLVHNMISIVAHSSIRHRVGERLPGSALKVKIKSHVSAYFWPPYVCTKNHLKKIWSC